MNRSRRETSGLPLGPFADADPRRVGLVLLILAMAVSTGLILYLERGTTFMSDEWGWIDYSTVGSLGAMFIPLNQHLTVLPLLLSKLFLAIWDTSILPFELAEVAGVMACGGAVYAFARPRIGPLMALAPAMVPMFLGTGSAILLQPLIGLQVIYSIAFGVAALAAVDRGTRGGDIAASILTCLSLASFSVGIAFLAGLAVAVLLSPEGKRRAYVFAVPAILYGAWRIWAMRYGSAGGPELANVPAVPFYYVDSIATTTTALFGRAGMIGAGPGTSLFLNGFEFDPATTAGVFAAIEAVVIVFVARRLARRGSVPVMLWSTLAVLLTLWTIQGLVLVLGRTPGEPRYIYPGAVAFALVVVAAAGAFRFSRLTVAVVLFLAAVGIVGNMPRFKEGRAAIDFHAPRVRAYTGVMDLAGANADPAFIPAVNTPVASPSSALSITDETYLNLTSHYGPLGDSPSEIEAQNAEIRHGSDEVMTRLLELKLAPTGGFDPRRCRTMQAAGPGQIQLPKGGAILRADTSTPVVLRRFSEDEWVPVGTLKVGAPTLLRIPPDQATATIPWILGTPEPVALTVCAPSS
jgi:hypothetical protein